MFYSEIFNAYEEPLTTVFTPRMSASVLYIMFSVLKLLFSIY